MCPIFRSEFPSAKRCPRRRYIYSFFPREKRAPRSPLLFFSLRVSPRDAHRVSPASIRARTAAEKYLALTRRSSTQMGIESWARIVLEIAAFSSCMSKIEEGWEQEGVRGFEKGVCDHRWQADGFRLRQRHGKRKREIFHGLCSVIAIACYFSGGRSPFIFFFYLPTFSDAGLNEWQWHVLFDNIFIYFYFYILFLYINTILI